MNIFSYVKTRLSLLQVMADYATVKKVGSNWSCCCPFHQERTASCVIHDEKGVFYCFGCHAGGDVISFIAKIEKCSPLEAIHHIVDRYGIDIPDSIWHQNGASKEQKPKYQAVCELVTKWCEEHLKKNSTVIQYLVNRGFNAESLVSFRVGYFPGGLHGVKDIINRAKNQALLVDDLCSAGILFQGKTVLYSPYEDRIIFPIQDHFGRICGFGGRIYKADDERPKYYNSRENEFFLKGSTLFGLDKAKKAIQKSGTVFLVEGYTDCMAMVQHGFTNTVATLGTACTLNHLKLLRRHAQSVTILFDGDAAGQQGILRLAEICWQTEMDLFVVSLPSGDDPASLLMRGEQLVSHIEKARDIFTFCVDSFVKNYNTLSFQEKIRGTRDLLNRLKSVEDSLKRDFLLQKASQALKIPFQTLKEELEKGIGELRGIPSIAEQGNKIEEIEPFDQEVIPLLEKKIFCAIMNNSDLFVMNVESINRVITYLSSSLSTILSRYQQFLAGNKTPSFTDFFDTLPEEEKRYVSRLILEEVDPMSPEDFDRLLVLFQKRQWKTMVATLKVQLSQAKREGNQEVIQKILHDFMSLQKFMAVQISKNY